MFSNELRKFDLEKMRSMAILNSYINGAALGYTIGENLKNTCAKFPNEMVLVSPYQNYRTTYPAFWNRASQAAQSLIAVREF